MKNLETPGKTGRVGRYVFLTCYISVPSFMYNLCYVVLLGNHLNNPSSSDRT